MLKNKLFYDFLIKSEGEETPIKGVIRRDIMLSF